MIKKKQKGRLPLIKKRGIYKKDGYISIKINKSLYLTPLHLKAIKLSISYYLGQISKASAKSNINYCWLLTSKHPIFNKSGQRLGGGKSKIKDYYYKIPKNFIILLIKFPIFTVAHDVQKEILNNKIKQLNSTMEVKNLSFEDSVRFANGTKLSAKQQLDNLTKLILKENKPKLLKEYINYITNMNKGLYYILKKYPFLSIKY